MWIKVDGCRTTGDVAAVSAAGADAFGMILAPGFRRTLPMGEAALLRRSAPAELLAVGVFVDQPADEVEAVARALGLDALQFHGAEDDEYCRAFRRRYRVIRTWRLAPPQPAEADWLLLEPGGRRGGGHGQAWAWRRAGARRPFLVAGGLTPDNVGEACAAVRPDGVDVSSGVETAGRKDPEKIARFCAAVREWEHGDGARGA